MSYFNVFYFGCDGFRKLKYGSKRKCSLRIATSSAYNDDCRRPLHELETLWMKDGIPIENTGISYSLNDPWNRTLSLVSANLTHTGKYTCQARLRSGGFPTVTADAQVSVLGKSRTKSIKLLKNLFKVDNKMAAVKSLRCLNNAILTG